MRRTLFTILITLLLAGCQESPPLTGGATRTLARERHAPERHAQEQYALVHGLPGGEVLLLGALPPSLPPEITVRARLRLRLWAGDAAIRPALTGDPEVLDGAIAANGQRIAVVTPEGRLLLARPGGVGKPVPTASLAVHPGLAFSPDGGSLAFTCGEAPETDVCLLDTEQLSVRRLTSHPAPDGQPAFAASGVAVIFSSGRSGTAALWTVNIRGDAAPRQMTNRGLGRSDILSARHVPPPVGSRGALVLGGSVLYDAGEGMVLVDGLGRHRVVAPADALPLPARDGERALLYRLVDGKPRATREVRP